MSTECTLWTIFHDAVHQAALWPIAIANSFEVRMPNRARRKLRLAHERRPRRHNLNFLSYNLTLFPWRPTLAVVASSHPIELQARAPLSDAAQRRIQKFSPFAKRACLTANSESRVGIGEARLNKEAPTPGAKTKFRASVFKFPGAFLTASAGARRFAAGQGL